MSVEVKHMLTTSKHRLILIFLSASAFVSFQNISLVINNLLSNRILGVFS